MVGATWFGRPNAATGLDAAACGPTCACGGEPWQAPEYAEAEIEAWTALRLETPFPEVLDDPYAAGPPDPPAEGAVCGVLAASGSYSLRTYRSDTEALADGARVTHTEACGVCSTLEDLAVYVRELDLTEPVRACGLDHLGGDRDAHVACLRDLGFTLPCAQIWYWNTLHTQSACLVTCLAELDSPYNLPDGSLNPCLQCDEDESGEVFKAVAGRTRRNTGVPNAICRPCDEVRPIEHRYP